MTILVILLCILTVYYFLAGMMVLAGTFRLDRVAAEKATPFVSVIIAARNEERDMGACLESLAVQDYPADRMEIIVVNDRSQDRTGAIITAFQNRYPFIKHLAITENPTEMPNKKHALEQGIGQSTGEILAFTDADCRVPPGWLSGLAPYFNDRTGLVAGYSFFAATGGLRSRLTALQAKAQEVVNAGIIGWGGAFSCTGRNLAYRRRVFDEVGGFDRIRRSVSGDDDLFLQLVRKKTNWQIRYATEPNTYVASKQPERMGTYAAQQKRHVSAARFYPLAYQFLGALVFLYFLVLVLSTGAAAGSWLAWSWPLWSAGIKFSVEMMLFLRAGMLFKSWSGWCLAPVLSVAYVGYVLFFSLVGLAGPVKWKE